MEPRIEDRLGDDDADHDEYFDPAEFAARAVLEDQHYWHLARREVVLEAVSAVVPPGSTRLLEIGCGAGTVATFLNAHGYHVDYADVHGAALDVARARARRRLGDDVASRRFIRMDVCRSDVPTGYDAILLLDVLEHLPDDIAVLSRLRDAVDDPGRDGLLVVTVPAFPMLWSPYDVVERHQRRYTRATLLRALSATGFEAERITYFFAPLFFGAGAVKALRTVRDQVRPHPAPEVFTDLVETRSGRLVTASMTRLLAAERRLLRRRSLPVGTSLLCVARPA
jgi:2-polyprenyl-3-methyl-5-hydroxy-6-metoxy-1,4-benzoquinol methylase